MLLSNRLGEERKRLRMLVTRLLFESCVIDCSSVEASWRARFKTLQLEAEFPERAGQAARRSFPRPAAFGFRLAGVHDRLEKRSRCDDRCLDLVEGVAADFDAGEFSVFNDEALDHFLAEGEVVLLLDLQLHVELIGLLIRLSPRTVHCRTLAEVQHAKLNAGFVDRPTHLAAEGVDFADDLAFGDAADRRVTAHRPDRITAHCEQDGSSSHPRSGESSFDTSVAGTDDGDVVLVDARQVGDFRGKRPVWVQSSGRNPRRSPVPLRLLFFFAVLVVVTFDAINLPSEFARQRFCQSNQLIDLKRSASQGMLRDCAHTRVDDSGIRPSFRSV